MKSTGENNSKQKILDAALEVFASKGFDGARVDEIAKTAGVNKALLYYYFESKEAILKELIEINAGAFLAQSDKLFHGLGITSETFTFEQMSSLVETGSEMYAGRKEILEIMLSETLKSGSTGTAFFDFSQSLMEDSIRLARELGFTKEDVQHLKTANLFMGIMPICLFTILGDKWANYSGYDQEHIRKIFLKIYKQVYSTIVSDLLSEK